MIKKPHINNLPPADKLDSEILEAMCQEGWLIPQTVDEVLQAERELAAATTTLPAELCDPRKVLKRPTTPLRLVRSGGSSSEQPMVENLARAARNGTPLPPEVEERMRRDREKAERKDNG